MSAAKPIRSRLALADGDAVFFICGRPDKFLRFAAAAPERIWPRQLDLVGRDLFAFCWVVDFPMYEWNEEEKKIDFSHNPFSMPQGGLEALLATKGSAGDHWHISTTSFATASSCRRAPSAITSRRS